MLACPGLAPPKQTPDHFLDLVLPTRPRRTARTARRPPVNSCCGGSFSFRRSTSPSKNNTQQPTAPRDVVGFFLTSDRRGRPSPTRETAGRERRAIIKLFRRRGAREPVVGASASVISRACQRARPSGPRAPILLFTNPEGSPWLAMTTISTGEVGNKQNRRDTYTRDDDSKLDGRAPHHRTRPHG